MPAQDHFGAPAKRQELTHPAVANRRNYTLLSDLLDQSFPEDKRKPFLVFTHKFAAMFIRLPELATLEFECLQPTYNKIP